CLDLLRWYPGEHCCTRRRVFPDDFLESVESDGMVSDESGVNASIGDQQMQNAVEQCDIGSKPRRQVDVGFFRSRRSAWIDNNELRRVWAASPIQDSHPEHCVSAGNVVPDMHDAVCLVDVEIAARLSIGPE